MLLVQIQSFGLMNISGFSFACSPSFIRLCLKVFANCSNSSKSVVSSGEGSNILDGVLRCCGVKPPELGVLGVNKLAGILWAVFGGVV